MTTISNKYEKARDFLTQMRYTKETIREILNKNICWEKAFILQRAKEENIPHMEEFLNNFDSLCPKGKSLIGERRKKMVFDTKTRKIYTSLTEINKVLKLSWVKIYENIDTGRFKLIGK